MAAQALHLSWYNPVQVTFGNGTLAHLPKDVPLVVLIDANAVPSSSPLSVQIRDHLGSQCIGWVEIKPTLSTLEATYTLSQSLWPHLTDPATTLMAIGGGTTLDMAKVLRFVPPKAPLSIALSADELATHWRTSHIPKGAARHPLWLAPSTAGTGSEVTSSATLWDTHHPAGAAKHAWQPHGGFADRAWIDPQLTHSCPVNVTRDCALDTLSHALEAIWNHRASPPSSALAVQAAQIILDTLPALLASLSTPISTEHTIRLREQMALASWQAGLAMSQTQTALAHALSYDLTLNEALPHGHACAVWLPMVWRMALGNSHACDAALAQLELGPEGLAHWLQNLGISPRHATPDCLATALQSPRGRNFIAAARH